MSYEHEYVEYDELGIVRIRCQCCGVNVASRYYREVDIKSDPPQKVNVAVLVKHGNYTRTRISLSDGSFIKLHMCTDCDGNDIDIDKDPEESQKLIAQLKRSSRNECVWSGKSQAELDEDSSRWDKISALKKIRSEISLNEAHEESVRHAIEFEEKEKVKNDARNI